MVNRYWWLFGISLVGLIVGTIALVLGLIFCKRIVACRDDGPFLLIALLCASVWMVSIGIREFSGCCKDYGYVRDHTCIEETAIMVEFTKGGIAYDGDGKMHYSQPKFYLIEKDEYVILCVNEKKVEVGGTYLIRYYPNTRICDVIAKVDA